MNQPASLRLSPLHETYRDTVTEWAALAGMPVPRKIAGADFSVRLIDASALPRCGCKGPGAAQWLTAQGLTIPTAFNTWAATDSGLIGRLAATEFFIEDTREGGVAARIRQALTRGASTDSGACYPVLREDAALILTGPHANDILLQTCNIDFAGLDMAAKPLVMSSMVGVSVLVIPQKQATGVVYRICCDPTFGPYLWRTLLAIVREQGGAAASILDFDSSL
jgi:sarcosine oxidase subunit gamma